MRWIRAMAKFTFTAKLGVAATSVISLLAFTWPLYLPESVIGFEITNNHYWIFFLFIPISLLLLALEINRGEIDVKAIALLGVFAALAAALRQIGAGAVGIEPIWFLIILASRVFGATFGFSLGAIAMSLSAILTGGIGPWLPFQIMAAAWIGFFAGSLPEFLRGKWELLIISIYAIFAGMSFGLLMDLQLWPWLIGPETSISFIQGGAVIDNLQRFLAFHFLTAMAWDIPRSILTATLIWVTGAPILNALRRTQRKVIFRSELVKEETAV
jgi:energy-coupling factor transport system substrate-specific component